MNDLTLIIPTKKEVESLPIFLKEIENYNCKKLIVLQKEDIETKKAIEKFQSIKILVQNNANINEKDNNGHTALTICANSFQAIELCDNIEVLIENGADVNDVI